MKKKILFLLLLIFIQNNFAADNNIYSYKQTVMYKVWLYEKIAEFPPLQIEKAAKNINPDLTEYINDPFSWLEKGTIPPTAEMEKLLSVLEHMNKLNEFIDTQENSLKYYNEEEREKMKELLSDIKSSSQQLSPDSAPPLKAAVSATSLPTEAVLLEGLTSFIISRARAEISVTVLTRLRHQMEGEFWADFFPNFYNFLAKASDIDAKSLLPSLRGAIQLDFKELPLKLAGFIEENPDKAPDIKPYIPIIKFVLENIYKMTEGENPIYLLANLRNLKPDMTEAKYKNLYHVLRISGNILNEVYHANVKINDKPLHDVLKDYKGQELFMTLFVKKYVAGINLTNMEEIISHLNHTISLVRQIEIMMSKIEEANNESKILQILALFENLVTTGGRYNILQDSVAEEMKNNIRIASGLFSSIIEKRYDKAVVTFANFLITKSDSSAKYIRFLSLAANLAGAKDGNDVETALEAFADPVGAYRIKREGLSKFAINSYLGINSGAEFIESKKPGAQYGVFAPVGIEWSFSDYTGLFLSILDLGSMVSYRFSEDDAVNEAPNETFRQVITPGAFFIYRITKEYPFTAGFGYHYSNRIRESDTGSVSSHRISLFLALDLTLMNF